MPVNLLTETVLSYLDATSRHLPVNDGRCIHVGTLHRWRLKGLRGIKLESLKIGGRWFTTREALERFFARLSGQGQTQPLDGPTPRRADEALAGLKAEGF